MVGKKSLRCICTKLSTRVQLSESGLRHWIDIRHLEDLDRHAEQVESDQEEFNAAENWDDAQRLTGAQTTSDAGLGQQRPDEAGGGKAWDAAADEAISDMVGEGMEMGDHRVHAGDEEELSNDVDGEVGEVGQSNRSARVGSGETYHLARLAMDEWGGDGRRQEDVVYWRSGLMTHNVSAHQRISVRHNDIRSWDSTKWMWEHTPLVKKGDLGGGSGRPGWWEHNALESAGRRQWGSEGTGDMVELSELRVDARRWEARVRDSVLSTAWRTSVGKDGRMTKELADGGGELGMKRQWGWGEEARWECGGEETLVLAVSWQESKYCFTCTLVKPVETDDVCVSVSEDGAGQRVDDTGSGGERTRALRARRSCFGSDLQTGVHAEGGEGWDGRADKAACECAVGSRKKASDADVWADCEAGSV
jgi:hypothetical protein